MDSRLDFKKNLEITYKRVSKTIRRLWKPQNLLPRIPLITVYKSFVKPHLDYSDVIYYHYALGHMMYGYTLLVQMNQRVLNKPSKERNISGHK